MKLHHLFVPVLFGLALASSCKEPQRTFDDASGGNGEESGGSGGVRGGAGPGAGSGGTAGSGPGSSGGEGAATAGGAGDGGGGPGDAGAGGEAGTPGGTTCRTDARRCRGKIPEICSAEGDWQALSAGCAFGCVNGVCNECEPDAKLCENGQSKVCVDGQWEVTPCDQLCESGDCVDSCTEGARQCDGQFKVQLCQSGAFVDDEECAGVCEAGECVGVCRPDDSRCQSGSKTVPEVCSATGEWVAATCNVPTPACLEGNCVACSPGATRCSLAGRPQLCSEFGSWVDQQPCSAETPACVLGTCRLCEPASRRCNAGRPQQCNPMGTAWVDGPACTGATPACVASTGTCGTCRLGDKQCGSETQIQSCNASGVWVNGMNCSGAAAPACLDGACVACTPGKTNCVGNTPQICSNTGTWVPQAACSGNMPKCVPETGTCECTEDAVDCADTTTPLKCTNGVWVPQAQCRGDTPLCVSGACQCPEGAIECLSSTQARSCTRGAWSTDDCIDPTPICVEGKGCLGCTPGTFRCSPDGTHRLGQCSSDGVYKEVEQCNFCSKGACENPATEADIIGCDATTGLICRATHCCNSPDQRSICGTPGLKCSGKFQNMMCDGPSDCTDPRLPICCATATGVGCVATLAGCTDAAGLVACDPVRPVCPVRTTCTRAAPNLFTCQ